jgi:hypothetical protein
MSGNGLTRANCIVVARPLDLVMTEVHSAQPDQEMGAVKEVNEGPERVDRIFLAFVRLTARGSGPQQIALKDWINAYVPLLSPLIVAAVVVLGLASLCAQNLSGGGGARQFKEDHSMAIQKLLFRP